MVEKTAQLYDIDVEDSDDTSYAYDYEVQDESYADDVLYAKDDEDEPQDEELVVLEFDKPKEQIMFVVPEIPGALDMSDIPEPEEDELVVREEEAKAKDIWDWKSSHGHSGFLDWLKDMIHGTPKHSGRDAMGLDRAMAWVENLSKEPSKAMRTDFKGEIDVNHCESIVDGLYKSLDAMEERKKQILRFKHPTRFKKKAWVQATGLVKEGQKSTRISGITIVVPLFISRLARILVNGVVSAGHSLEDMYDELKKEWKLTAREEAELQQLLYDMGYHIPQDRGIFNKEVDLSKSDNFDYSAQYQG